MGIVHCCWKPWWMPPGFEEPATGPPTGSTLGRPPDAVAWTGSTKATVKPSKTSTFTRWSAMPDDTYAAIPPGKQIRLIQLLGVEPPAGVSDTPGTRLGRVEPLIAKFPGTALLRRSMVMLTGKPVCAVPIAVTSKLPRIDRQ